MTSFNFFLDSLILFSEMEDNLHIFVNGIQPIKLKNKTMRAKTNSAGADGGPRSKVCSCLTLRLAPIDAIGNFSEDMLGGRFF